jgi:hypothetical protein
MSELPYEDPRVQYALQQLMRRLETYVGQPLENATLLAIRSLIEQTRTEFKLEFQHEFPLLVPLILPASGFVAWFRQDLDDDEIRIKVLNLLRELTMFNLPISAMELATAMKLAWPHYQPPIEYYRQAAQVKLLN